MNARSVVVGAVAALAIALSTQVAGIGGGSADAATRKVALGVGMYNGTDLSMLDGFRDSIGGQRVAAWTIWRGWNPANNGIFPTAAAVGARERGATPVIWWEPYSCCDPANPKWTRNLNITSGLYDDYIRAFARDAKAFGTRVLLRFAHQANSDYLPWAWDYSTSDDNTVDTFIASWRHVHRIFDDVGATNVKWVWTVATQTCAGDGKEVAFTVTNCMSRSLGYPGNAWVDYMGFTWENWATAGPGSVDPLGTMDPDDRWVRADRGASHARERQADHGGRDLLSAGRRRSGRVDHQRLPGRLQAADESRGHHVAERRPQRAPDEPPRLVAARSRARRLRRDRRDVEVPGPYRLSDAPT